MFDIKGILNDKLKEADKKFEPYGGLAVMMTTRDYAALEFLKTQSYVTEKEIEVAFQKADMFVAAKKARTKSS